LTNLSKAAFMLPVEYSPSRHPVITFDTIYFSR